MTQYRGGDEAAHQGGGARRDDTGEGGWDDWWSSDRLDAVGWAAIFVWGAVVVLATYTDFSEDLSWWDGWGVFFVGAGAIVLIEAVARLFVPRYRSKWAWTFMWGMIALSIGLGGLFGWAWLALALVAVAVVILVDASRRTS